MNRKNYTYLGLLLILALLFSGCQTGETVSNDNQKTIVVTYSILGSVVDDLVGGEAYVIKLMPNGQDPHEWEPSARDIETLMKADLIVQNGLDLEGGMQKALAQAQEQGVKFFTASDHIQVRHVGKGEGLPSGDPDQAEGAEDPHLWTDPVAMKSMIGALAIQIHSDLGIDLSGRAADLENRLDALNAEIASEVNTLPAENRKLVTGHESMGYYAQRYGFQLIGALVPSLTSDAETSASELADLKQKIQDNHVKAIFTELGTPKSVSAAIGEETGVKVVEITTHSLAENGTYFTFMRDLTDQIVKNLR